MLSKIIFTYETNMFLCPWGRLKTNSIKLYSEGNNKIT